ncbi:MAG: (2Fe-2S) ferredoxin domain-containing protein, partial [Candidatus Neomarinimicrobiota bacterium]
MNRFDPTPRYAKHIFVCVNERPPANPKGCCAARGSQDIRLEFVKLIREYGLKGKVRANKAGCLDGCELGPTIVIYPDNVWYTGCSIDDVPEIFELSVRQSGVVKRLVATDETWERL